jgi:hypothetical protein
MATFHVIDQLPDITKMNKKNDIVNVLTLLRGHFRRYSVDRPPIGTINFSLTACHMKIHEYPGIELISVH